MVQTAADVLPAERYGSFVAKPPVSSPGNINPRICTNDYVDSRWALRIVVG